MATDRSPRVLYSFPDAVGKPGIGVTAMHQLRGLSAQGVELVLYCASQRESAGAPKRTVRTLELAGRRIPHRLLGVERAYRYHDLRVASALRRLGTGAVDLVHCWPRAATATARAARQLGVPVVREVVSSHTGYVFDVVARESARLGVTPPAGHDHTFDPVRLRQEEEEFRLADFLLAPSEFSRDTFIERGVSPERLLMHRYGYDPARYRPERRNGRADGRPFTALFAARCEPLKGLHLALEAWCRSGLAEHGRFVICGSFVPGYRRAVQRWLDHPSVEEHGFVQDLDAVMRESDALVLPSLVEGSALVSYEAQASGCVLLASNASGARCEHGEHGLVHRAGDVDQLAAQLRWLHARPERLEALRNAALAHARTLTWDDAAEELLGAYRTALATREREGRPALIA